MHLLVTMYLALAPLIANCLTIIYHMQYEVEVRVMFTFYCMCQVYSMGRQIDIALVCMGLPHNYIHQERTENICLSILIIVVHI